MKVVRQDNVASDDPMIRRLPGIENYSDCLFIGKDWLSRGCAYREENDDRTIARFNRRRVGRSPPPVVHRLERSFHRMSWSAMLCQREFIVFAAHRSSRPQSVALHIAAPPPN